MYLNNEKGINALFLQVTKYKRLVGGIEFVDAIPKSLSGKILRRELKEDYHRKHGKA